MDLHDLKAQLENYQVDPQVPRDKRVQREARLNAHRDKVLSKIELILAANKKIEEHHTDIQESLQYLEKVGFIYQESEQAQTEGSDETVAPDPEPEPEPKKEPEPAPDVDSEPDQGEPSQTEGVA